MSRVVSKTKHEYITLSGAGFPSGSIPVGSTLHFIDLEPGDDDRYIFYNGLWEIVEERQG